MATHYAVNPQTGERLAFIGGAWVPATPAGSSSGAPKLTEAQAKDGFNAKRMSGAASIINPLEQGGYDAGAAKLIPGFLPMADEKRKYEAAANEWADSMLRMTTGAAATKDEVANTVNTYFPRLGDSPAVRQQKAQMRQRVQQDALTRAGPAGMTDTAKTGGGQIPLSREEASRGRRGGVSRPQATSQAAPKRLRYNPDTGNIE